MLALFGQFAEAFHQRRASGSMSPHWFLLLVCLTWGCGSREIERIGVAVDLYEIDQAVIAHARGDRDSNARHALRSRLGHDNPTVRAHAAQSVGHVLDWESMPTLITLIEDADPLVRARAAVAIGRLLGQHFVLSTKPTEDEIEAYLANVHACYAEMQRSPPPQYR